MSVVPSDVVCYGSANMPEADSATIGGAVTTGRRVAWYDLSANDTLDATSSSTADTATKISVGARNAGGTIVTATGVTLTGQTPVVNVGTLGTVERLLYAAISGSIVGTFPLANPTGTAAVGDVALYRHTAVISGHTAQTGAANTTGVTPPLFKLQSGDGSSVAPGMIILITNNTPSGAQYQLRQVIGWATNGTSIPSGATVYGADTVAISKDWGIIPTSSTTYNILQGMLFEILPNPVTTITRCFATASADVPGGSSRTYYEKIFVVNNNTTTDLTTTQIEILQNTPTLPAGALLDCALCTALNDTNTTTNRQTVPASGAGSFITQPSLITVPGAGSLTGGAAPNAAGAMGVWARLTLPAGTGAYKGAALVRAQGTTI